MGADVKLSDDQFWALERWMISIATQAGFHNPLVAAEIRKTAFIALTGREPAGEAATAPSEADDSVARQRRAREQLQEIRSS
jgi:hypothetical protein